MTQSGPPVFTPEQRAAALAKAGEARRLRAEVKELLKTGSVTLVEVLARGETEDYIGGMKVQSVLESLPGLGKIKTKRLMEELGIASNRRLRGLGDRRARRPPSTPRLNSDPRRIGPAVFSSFPAPPVPGSLRWWQDSESEGRCTSPCRRRPANPERVRPTEFTTGFWNQMSLRHFSLQATSSNGPNTTVANTGPCASR